MQSVNWVSVYIEVINFIILVHGMQYYNQVFIQNEKKKNNVLLTKPQESEPALLHRNQGSGIDLDLLA